MTDHIVQFSGGVGSWAAARRVRDMFGTKDLILLCADTLSESDDWYEFVELAAADIGGELVMLRDGRDVWELAFDNHMIPNTRADFCSRILKRELLWSWIDLHPGAIVYVGIDITEIHRIDPIRAAHADIPIIAPLADWEPVVLWKGELLIELAKAGLPIPRAYESNLPHNNCLKHGCVKGGHAYWRTLYRDFPDTFARTEQLETEFRTQFGDYSILRDRTGGVTRPMPLTELRERIEEEMRHQPSLFIGTDFGDACACL